MKRLKPIPAGAPQDGSALTLTGSAYLLAMHGRVESTVTLRRPQCKTPMPSEFQTGPRCFQELACVYGTPSEGSRCHRQKTLQTIVASVIT